MGSGAAWGPIRDASRMHDSYTGRSTSRRVVPVLCGDTQGGAASRGSEAVGQRKWSCGGVNGAEGVCVRQQASYVASGVGGTPGVRLTTTRNLVDPASSVRSSQRLSHASLSLSTLNSETVDGSLYQL